jgi:hypothetical protein
MLGFLIGVVAGGFVVWKYRDSLEPVRDKVDGLLGTVQEKSETLLDQAKDRLSAGIESTRDKVRSTAGRANATE